MFHNLCYTHHKMQADSLPERRASWPIWAEFLRQRGLENLAAWVLETAGPLTVLGAQAFYLASPLLHPVLSNGQAQALAALLEDQREAKAFADFLREEIPS
jgi:hypothetical protein